MLTFYSTSFMYPSWYLYRWVQTVLPHAVFAELKLKFLVSLLYLCSGKEGKEKLPQSNMEKNEYTRCKWRLVSSDENLEGPIKASHLKQWRRLRRWDCWGWSLQSFKLPHCLFKKEKQKKKHGQRFVNEQHRLLRGRSRIKEEINVGK